MSAINNSGLRAHGYVPIAGAEKREMLDALGIESVYDLFSGVPGPIRLNRPLRLPPGKSEMETLEYMGGLAAQNTVFTAIYRGAGAYRHYIPSIVKRIASKEEFVTAYTPYQPEISQGVLQCIFEFQTMVCELTGMDASNASVYDGAVAAAEAVSMCRDRKKSTAVVSATAHPNVIETIKTYCGAADARMVLVPQKNGVTDADELSKLIDGDTACVYIQQPNYYGQLEDARRIGELAHGRGAKFIMGVNPISLAVLAPPGECGADVAVGEGQPLGLPLAFGGPYLGFMACKRELVRKLPGRIVGETLDRRGDRAFVLTLQAREQHIRREKAASNICTNQALCVLTAVAYLAAMGPSGLRSAAEQCMENAALLKQRLSGIGGFDTVFDGPFFHEFVTRCPIPPDQLEQALEPLGILPGLPLGGELSGCVLWCATECNTAHEIDALVDAIKSQIAEARHEAAV